MKAKKRVKKKGSGVSQQPGPKEMNKKEVYMKHEEKPFKRDRRISQRACQRVKKQSFSPFFCCIAKVRIFLPRCFFIDKKLFNCVWLRLVSAVCRVGRFRLPVLFQRYPSARPPRRRVYLHQSHAGTSLYARRNVHNAVPSRKAL